MLQVIITSSVLILILIGLRYLMRGRISQRLQYGLWLLAALRLLLPFQIGSLSISISNLTNDTSTSVNQMMAQPVRQIQATRLEEPRESQPAQTPEAEVNSAGKTADAEAVPPVTAGPNVTGQTANSGQPATPDVLPERQTAEAGEPVTVGQVLQLVWLSGVGLMALWFLGVNLLYNRRVRRSAEPWAVEGSPIPVMVSDAIQSPCLLGFFRPRVYLTMACAADPEATRHVLAHELTHYRHGDLLWSVVRSACLCLHWYNPLVWWAASLSRRDCELACDEGALRKLGEGERLPYGRTLITMIARASTPVNLLQTATTMAANKKQLKERVVMIAKKRKLYTVVTVVLLLVVCTVVGCTFAGAEIKPTLDRLDDVQRIPSKQTEPDDTEEPSETGDSASVTVLAEGERYRISRFKQSGALQYILFDKDGNEAYSELLFDFADGDVQVNQVGNILQFSDAFGRCGFYDTERNRWSAPFGYANVSAFDGKYIAQIYPADAGRVLITELFNPLVATQRAYIDDMAQVKDPVSAAEFSPSGESLFVTYLNDQNEEVTVEILLEKLSVLDTLDGSTVWDENGSSSVRNQVQEDYITDEFYWPHVTSAVDVEYVDGAGNTYRISIPRIEMPGPNIEAINQEIYDRYDSAIPGDDDEAWPDYTGYGDITYKWFTNADVLSLVIMPTVYAGNTGDDYDIYNVSISKCRLLTDEEVYAASGVENLEVRIAHAIACYAGELRTRDDDAYQIFFGDGSSVSEMTLGSFADDISWANVEAARPYLGRDGDLYINGCAHTAAGSGRHWGDIRLDDYMTDVVYSARQYYEYYRQPEGQRSWPEAIARVSAETQVSYTPTGTLTAAVSEVTGGVKNSNYHIPQIDLPGSNIEAINREIYNDYSAPSVPYVENVSYEWAVNGDILSLVIFGTSEDGAMRTYSAYNVSISQCRLLSDDELYAAAGVESPEITVLHAISMEVARGLAEKNYDEYYVSSPQHTVKLLQRWQDAQMLDRIMPYLNDEGKLCVQVQLDMTYPSYSPFTSWQKVCISDYPTELLYEPTAYFYAFYHG